MNFVKNWCDSWRQEIDRISNNYDTFRECLEHKVKLKLAACGYTAVIAVLLCVLQIYVLNSLYRDADDLAALRYMTYCIVEDSEDPNLSTILCNSNNTVGMVRSLENWLKTYKENVDFAIAYEDSSDYNYISDMEAFNRVRDTFVIADENGKVDKNVLGYCQYFVNEYAFVNAYPESEQYYELKSAYLERQLEQKDIVVSYLNRITSWYDIIGAVITLIAIGGLFVCCMQMYKLIQLTRKLLRKVTGTCTDYAIFARDVIISVNEHATIDTDIPTEKSDEDEEGNSDDQTAYL